jgi:hypothetical protein
MAKADSLFLLIKSLTAGEKALVRQVDKGQTAYIALFDFMSRQREYDERKAKKKLQQLGHTINFAYAKNYLTKHILRVLREHEDIGEHAGIRHLQEIELLMRRRVTDLAAKMLAKAREKALAEERWHDFLQLSNSEMALLVAAEGDLNSSLAAIEQLNAERRQARALLQNLGEFEDLYHRYRPALKRKQNARNEWDLALVQQFAADPLLRSSAEAKSKRALRLYYMCQSMIHAYAGRYPETHAALLGSVGLYRDHPYLRADYPDGYLTDLWRLAGHHLHAGTYSEVERILLEINAERERPGVHASDIFEKYTRLLLSYALTAKRHALVEAELSGIEEGLASHADTIPWTSQAVLCFLMGRLHFEQGRLREAKRWLNQILDHPARGQREDICSLSRILLIFIYFEEGESDLVEATSRSTRKYLQRRDALYQFERRILRFLEQHSFSDRGPQFAQALAELHKDLIGIFKDPLEANILAFFDIMGWLEGKMNSSQGK